MGLDKKVEDEKVWISLEYIKALKIAKACDNLPPIMEDFKKEK